MHAIVTVIHKEDVCVESMFERYLYDNDTYYELQEFASKEEAFKDLERRAKTYRENATNENLPDNSRDMYKRFVEEIEALDTDEKKIEWYLEDNGSCSYNEEKEMFYETYNPWGYCDWYVIGGRWADSLVDYNGEGHNTLALKEFNRYNKESLQCPYGYVLNYRDDDYLYDTVDDKEWDQLLADAFTFMEQTGEELYITLVDIHM